jgi:anti-sigma factor RsiW
MTDREPDFETLSAYVDGELAPAERESFERQLARDERLARRVEALVAMKQGVAALGGDIVVLQMPARRPSWRIAGWAAAAAAICMMAAVAWYGHAPASADVVAGAVAAHDGWSEAAGLPASSSEIDALAWPDLAAAGLKLVAVRPDIAIDRVRAAQAVYAGQHGCRLSLFALKEAGPSEPFHLSSTGDLQTAVWTVGTAHYIAVARRLNARRFAVLAGAMQAMPSRKGPLPAELIAQLESAHQPCSG